MMVLMEITTWHDIENGHHIDNDDNDGFVEELSVPITVIVSLIMIVIINDGSNGNNHMTWHRKRPPHW